MKIMGNGKGMTLIWGCIAVAAVFFTLRLSVGGGAESVSVEEAKQLLAQGRAVLVDVREKDEVDAGMLKGATWLPLSGLQSGDTEVMKNLESLGKTREILAYCRSGARSGRAAGILIAKGFKVRNLGGYESAKAGGLPSQ
jgi:rhodanese-related sulfurtransferase